MMMSGMKWFCMATAFAGAVLLCGTAVILMKKYADHRRNLNVCVTCGVQDNACAADACADNAPKDASEEEAECGEA